MTSAHVLRYIEFFEGLKPASLGSLGDFFHDNARFVDPFNDVQGKTAIARVFEHMFSTCDEPRFSVDECVGDDVIAYLRWRFSFGRGPTRRVVNGVSRVQFGSDGLAVEHRDYWDPASELYETLPLFGRLFRALRRHLSAPQGATPRHTNPLFHD